MDYYWGKYLNPVLNLVNVAYDTSGGYIIAMTDYSIVLLFNAVTGNLLAQKQKFSSYIFKPLNRLLIMNANMLAITGQGNKIVSF